MARFSANLAEVEGSDGYIVEVSLDGGSDHPITELDLEDIGSEMGRNQLYVRTTDTAGTRDLLSRVEEQIDLDRLPALLLLSEDPAEAEEAGVWYLDGIETEEEARLLIRELVDTLYDPEFMEENPAWEGRLENLVSLLPPAIAHGADALTYIDHISL